MEDETEPDKLAVAEVLANFFDHLGDHARDHAELCRSLESSASGKIVQPISYY